MEKVYYSEQPGRILFLPQADGNEVYLRKNIECEETEDGAIWTADEVFIKTQLSEEEVEAKFDDYFYEEPETTIEDCVEMNNILLQLILGGAE